MTVNPIPEGYHTVTPILCVPDVEGLIAFAEKAFDAEETFTFRDDEGQILHAEMRIGDSMVMMTPSNDKNPPLLFMLQLYLEDVDGTYERALEAGGNSLSKPHDEFYGDRMAGVFDPYGNQWWIGKHVEDVSEEELWRRMAEQ